MKRSVSAMAISYRSTKTRIHCSQMLRDKSTRLMNQFSKSNLDYSRSASPPERLTRILSGPALKPIKSRGLSKYLTKNANGN